MGDSSSISRRDFLQLSGGALASTQWEDKPSSQQSPPNIVFLLADDLGYGDLQCYGHPRIRTPNLDRLATDGLRLTSLYSSPTCVPSRYQLLTGRHLARSEIRGTGATGTGGLSEDEVTLAEGVQKAGYETHMVGKWHLGHAESRFLPTHHGFDSWFGVPYSNDGRVPWVDAEEPLRLYRDTTPVGTVEGRTPLTPRYTKEAVRSIQEVDSPFLLYFAYNMPHLPLQVPPRFQGRSDAGLYGDAVELIDWSVGRILEALDATGQRDNTIVVFASDNGPWLDLPRRMRRGKNERWHAGSPGPFRGHKATTYEGGVRVPGLVRWPGEVPEARTSSDIVGLHDFYPTLLRAAGGQIPQDRPLDGKNVLPFLRGERPSPRTHYYYFERHKLEAVRAGPWKLRLQPQFKRQRQLFHLHRDPGERFNVVRRYPERADQLEARLNAFAEEVGAQE